MSGVLNRSAKQKVVTSTVSLSIMAGIIVLAGLLIWKGSKLNALPTPATVDFGAGGLRLFELQRTARDADGYYRASVQFLPGMIAYGLAWTGMAAAVIARRLRKA